MDTILSTVPLWQRLFIRCLDCGNSGKTNSRPSMLPCWEMTALSLCQQVWNLEKNLWCAVHVQVLPLNYPTPLFFPIWKSMLLSITTLGQYSDLKFLFLWKFYQHLYFQLNLKSLYMNVKLVQITSYIYQLFFSCRGWEESVLPAACSGNRGCVHHHLTPQSTDTGPGYTTLLYGCK